MQKSSVDKFIALLATTHYSSAFVELLICVVDEAESVKTLQQLHELIERECSNIIEYFKENPKSQRLIEGKNPLCLESIKEYVNRVFKGVSKRHGSDVKEFKAGLRLKLKELIQFIKSSTNKVAQNAEFFWTDRGNRKVMIYSYSKSVVQAIKKAHKSLESSLVVYICLSGPLHEGMKSFKELSVEGVNCVLINDNEIGYYMQEIGCVMLGCEVVLENGSIINRTGTYLVSLCAKEASKPVYVFAESYKFVKRILLTQKDIPQISLELTQSGNGQRLIPADLTPSSNIRLFCTDLGIFPPQGVTSELNKIFS